MPLQVATEKGATCQGAEPSQLAADPTSVNVKESINGLVEPLPEGCSMAISTSREELVAFSNANNFAVVTWCELAVRNGSSAIDLNLWLGCINGSMATVGMLAMHARVDISITNSFCSPLIHYYGLDAASNFVAYEVCRRAVPFYGRFQAFS